MTGDPRPYEPPAEIEWRKSSFSSLGNCVEVAPTAHRGQPRIAVRNSLDPDGPTVLFTSGEWAAFLLGVKHQEFDDLV